MPTLEQKIKEYDAIKRTKVPGDVLAVMEGATEALRASGLGQGAFVTGDQFPDFTLPDQHGVVRPLSHYLAEGPVVLNIYRGGWCPYCNLEMQALNIALPEFVKRGVTLLGLTPEMPTTVQDTLTANELAITVLSDEGNRVSASLGLVFELPEVLAQSMSVLVSIFRPATGMTVLLCQSRRRISLARIGWCATTSSMWTTPNGQSLPS
ncbi:peroxiredoxin family protein [Aeromonas veronii]